MAQIDHDQNQLPMLPEPPVSSDRQSFNYDALGQEKSIFLRQRTEEIRRLAQTTMLGIVEIGRRLIEVKDLLEHGLFMGWLRHEFPSSVSTAENYINLAKLVDNNPNGSEFLARLTPRAAYLLASRRASQDAVAHVIARAEQGEQITRSIVHRARIEYPSAKSIKARAADSNAGSLVTSPPDAEQLRRMKASVALAWELYNLLDREYQALRERADGFTPIVMVDAHIAADQAQRLREAQCFIEGVEAILAGSLLEAEINDLVDPQDGLPSEQDSAQDNELTADPVVPPDYAETGA